MARNQRQREAADTAEVNRVRRCELLVGLLLLSATLAVYWQVSGYEFVNIDDREFITTNPHVRAGLSWQGLVWALTTDYAGNWFPLTWLSHMMDCRLFGLDSGFHHLTNALIHAFSSLLLFLLLKRMTGALWRSAFVALLFALHPLHVESVAWVTERRDVLSAFFWFLTLWGYARYVERPHPARYAAVILLFCLGLMSKAMVVTLPFVLLLFDIWPLRRVTPGTSEGLAPSVKKVRAAREATSGFTSVLLEKAPFFALSALSAIITIVAQRRGGAIVSLDHIPMGTRIANALISYMSYILNMLWPTNLAVFYPQSPALHPWRIAVAFALLAAVSFLVIRLLRVAPYLSVGWFWYLGTLVPVIGIVQVGMQARADRYTYLPLIGIFIMIAWGAADLLKRWRHAKPALAGALVLTSAACALLTWHQAQFWRDSMTLFRHALDVTVNNHVAHNGLGIALQEQGHLGEAMSHYREAIRLRPGYGEARTNLGAALLKSGRAEEAVQQLSETIRLSPGALEAHIELGIAYNTLGRYDEAIAQLLDAVRIEPDSANAHYNLGSLYSKVGRLADAATHFTLAARLQPDNAEIYYNLGVTLARAGDMNGAVAEFTKALRIRPDYGAAHNNIGSILANRGDIDEAILHYREALRLMPGSEQARLNLEYALSLKK